MTTLGKTIHVVREALGLGDVVSMLPALAGLQRGNPRTVIVAHVAEPYAEFLSGLGINVRVVEHPEDVREMRGFPIRDEWLQANVGDGERVVDLYGPEIEIEKQGEPNICRTEAFCRRAGVPFTPPRLIARDIVDSGRADPLADFALYQAWEQARPRRPVVGIHTESAGLIRRWPLDSWRLVADAMLDKGHILRVFADDLDPWRTDYPDSLEIQCGPQKWDVLLTKINECTLFIGVDSGLIHIAAALGVPTLVLTGPTDGRLLNRQYGPHLHYVSPAYRFTSTDTGEWPRPNGTPRCSGPCYARNERGFFGGPCVRGCHQMAKIAPERVVDFALRILKGYV